MTKQNIDIKQFFNMPPQKAVEYMQNKGYKVTNDWREIWEDAHAKAFTVAKMTNVQLLKNTKGTLETALKEGWGEQKTKRELKNMFWAKGWWGKKIVTDSNGDEKEIQLGSNYRVNTIYRQNIQSAFNAGRYIEQLEDVDFAPYFQYICILNEQTRPEHRALNGKVFRYDDPIWAAIYPPNGWGCRCFVRSLTQSDLERLGLKIEKSDGKLSYKDVVINKETGETKQIAILRVEDKAGRLLNFQTDAGWSSSVGKAAWNIDVLAYNASLDMPQSFKDKFISDMAQNPLKKKVFENFITKINMAEYKVKGLEVAAGWMSPNITRFLSEAQKAPASPVVVFGDDRAIHSKRTAKNTAQVLTSKQRKEIANIFTDNDGVYWDETQKEQRLLYIKHFEKPDSDGKEAIKVIVHPNYLKKSRKLNYIITVGRIKKSDLKNPQIKKIE